MNDIGTDEIIREEEKMISSLNRPRNEVVAMVDRTEEDKAILVISPPTTMTGEGSEEEKLPVGHALTLGGIQPSTHP